MRIDLPSPLAVVCHDAGATNLIIGWIAGHFGSLRVCAEGPARPLWLGAFPEIKPVALDDALNGAAALLSGSGWASDLEYDARTRARARGIRNIAVIDHWVNYTERFVRHGATVLPDEVWVADDEAAAEVRRCFPALPIKILPNAYLEKMLEEVAAFHPAPARRDPKSILYVLEPIRGAWGHSGEPGEFQSLAYFLEKLPALGVRADVEIRLRPHPSEPTCKYDEWPARYPHLTLVVDSGRALAEQVGWADWVVGCETFALVVALRANRIALSSLPPWAPRCRLPQRELLHVQDLLMKSA